MIVSEEYRLVWNAIIDLKSLLLRNPENKLGLQIIKDLRRALDILEKQDVNRCDKCLENITTVYATNVHGM
jgi:hypothetical protein